MNINKNHPSGLIDGLGIEQIEDKVYLFFRSSADPGHVTRIARSLNGLEFELIKKSQDIYHPPPIDPKFKNILKPRKNFFDHQTIEIEGTVKISSNTLVFYHHLNSGGEYQVGLAVYAPGKTKKCLFRSKTPIWESSTAWSGKNIKFIGLAYTNCQIISYWGVDSRHLYAVIYPCFKVRHPDTVQSLNLCLDKHPQNPIIKPKTENSWEAFNTFNPAAIYEGGQVHILYRAQGFDYVSVVGYASSRDGVTIEERLNDPIYLPKEPFEWVSPDITSSTVSGQYISGGGYGGIEDPRITRIDDRLYMTYVAFNGRDPPRVALTSIALDDFLNRRWLWEKAVLISPPGIVDKSCVIFPEKVNGKYVIMHRIFPNILIDFVDDLNFDGSTWLEGKYKIPPRLDMWDSRKIGAGAPPIKTKDGWLLIYQSVDDRDDKKYLIGAMLLDLNDPTKVLHRSRQPILRPQQDYENQGFKMGVVYPCGAVVINGTLFVYYGAADSYVCVATADLKEFLDRLSYTEDPILSPAIISRI